VMPKIHIPMLPPPDIDFSLEPILSEEEVPVGAVAVLDAILFMPVNYFFLPYSLLPRREMTGALFQKILPLAKTLILVSAPQPLTQDSTLKSRMNC
jgi:hypothetical protein